MNRDSLPLLIALLVPLAGAVGLLPGQPGAESQTMPPEAAMPQSPASLAAITPIRLTLPEGTAPGPAIAGLWLDF